MPSNGTLGPERCGTPHLPAAGSGFWGPVSRTCLDSSSLHRVYSVMNFRASRWASRKPSATSMISQISSKSGTTMAQGLGRSEASRGLALPAPPAPPHHVRSAALSSPRVLGGGAGFIPHVDRGHGLRATPPAAVVPPACLALPPIDPRVRVLPGRPSPRLRT